MKLKVQSVFDATQVLATIINEGRPLPQKGRYRVARAYAKLSPEWTVINERRTSMIMAYDYKNADDQVAVPDDKMEEFVAAWADFAKDEIEVDVQPIPIDQLSVDGAEGCISFAEFATLGELVVE